MITNNYHDFIRTNPPKPAQIDDATMTLISSYVSGSNGRVLCTHDVVQLSRVGTVPLDRSRTKFVIDSVTVALS